MTSEERYAFEITVELMKAKLSNSMLSVSQKSGTELGLMFKEVYNHILSVIKKEV